MGVAIRYAPDEDTAKDLVQEGWILIFKNLSSWKGTNFKSWIARIVANKAVDRLRKKDIFKGALDIDELATVESADPDIVAELSHKELLQLIQELPMRSKLNFNLCVIEGFSHSEAARQLNITEGTSKSQLSKARAYLQQRIQSIREV